MHAKFVEFVSACEVCSVSECMRSLLSSLVRAKFEFISACEVC